jgi:hypothetical protein
VIDAGSTLADVCFAVSAALNAYGIACVLTGGSAAALYAPQAYLSHDADFVLSGDEPLREVATALAPIGFRRYGRSRIFIHAKSEFTVDFPKGPLAVGRDYIHETNVIERGDVKLCILTRTDCVRDRLAHYYYWSDYTALNAAVGVAVHGGEQVDLATLRAWTERESPDFLVKLAEFERRLAQSGNAL